MRKTAWLYNFLLFFWTHKTRADQLCPEMTSENFQITWLQTMTKTISSPPCVGKNKEFLYRDCENGTWAAEPDCDSIQATEIPSCPDNLTESFLVCYTYTPKSKFPPKCPYDNVLSFRFFETFVPADQMYPVWVPVKRDRTNGIEFFRWTEPSANYREEYTEYIPNGKIADKDCILFYNRSYHIPVSCEEEHSGICVYQQLQYFETPCLNCAKIDFNSKSNCICYDNGSEIALPKVEFPEMYENSISLKWLDINCTIGLEKLNGSYLWTGSQTEIDYTFWNSDTVFDDHHIYGALTKSGWILTETPLSCSLYQQAMAPGSPKLLLQWDFLQNVLVLQLIEPSKFLTIDKSMVLFCFTDAMPFELIYRYSAFNVSYANDSAASYTLTPQSYGPGSYWCESWLFYGMEVITTDKVFLRLSNNVEFVLLLESTYPEENALNHDILIYIQQILNQTVGEGTSLQDYTYRIMKIVDLDEDNKKMTVNIHLSNTTDVQNFDQEVNSTKAKLVAALSSLGVKMLSFKSSDFCFLETGNLTWATTAIGDQTYPLEYCFLKNTTRMTRLCGGDFYDGGQWEPVSTCMVFPTSSYTPQLEFMINNHQVTSSLVGISASSKLSPLDVYLIGLALQAADTPDLKILTQTVDNLLQTNRTILAQSQQYMDATNQILFTVKALLQSKLSSCYYPKENFVLRLATNYDSSGLVLILNKNKISASQKFSLNETETIKNFDTGVFYGDDLLQELTSQKSTSLVTIFYNNSFFSDDSIAEQTFPVSGLFWSTNTTSPVYLVQKSDDDVQKDCAIWVHNHWKRVGVATKNSSLWYCKFITPGFYTILNNNIRDNLEDVLNSNSSNDTMFSLSEISSRYEEFDVYDVHLLGQIFAKVKSTADLNLDAMAATVNNIHDIDREVLLRSQVEEGATDAILYNLDQILHNQKAHVNITTRKFQMLVFNPNSDFVGIAIVNHSFQAINNSLDDLGSFDSAVLFSADLINQITDPIIITVFENDALFNQEEPSSTTGKVLGVVLPKPINGSGSVYVYQHTDKLGQSCAFWDYNVETAARGHWKMETNAILTGNYTLCEYSHTTHFALLVVEELPSTFFFIIVEEIATVNSILSLIGLGCIVLTAVFFSKWRRNSGNQILLNFSIAIILHITIIYFASCVNPQSNYILCTVVGVLLHYSVLSSFMWMLIIAILQFKRFVEVFSGPPKRILLKSCLAGWGVPLVPATYVLLFDGDSYTNGVMQLCYPSGLGLYLGVWLPLALIILINTILFIYIIYSVVRKRSNVVVHIGKNETVLQWRLGIFLFFMLGLSWAFGLLADFTKWDVFIYIFSFTATLQGFVVFLFFIVFNSNTRGLYLNAIKKMFSKLCPHN